ncbi:MucR family transcriptional regulator [Curvibacter lanceolatus]|uniref:MucR family transcriptional regulator n=1 Tax=Curvibacter lanceolatus TaxID=86182 RepID=UPI000A04EE49|nr:MucR family transcriptional regulator [Curvibacter lanceolatus]
MPKIDCRVCGKKFHFLPTHLNRTHGISADEYRLEFKIPAGQPLCSPEYSAAHQEKIRRMQANGAISYDHLPAATEAAKSRPRVERVDLAKQAERARMIPRQQFQPGEKRADGRDADRAREYQRAWRAKQKAKK